MLLFFGHIVLARLSCYALLNPIWFNLRFLAINIGKLKFLTIGDFIFLIFQSLLVYGVELNFGGSSVYQKFHPKKGQGQVFLLDLFRPCQG